MRKKRNRTDHIELQVEWKRHESVSEWKKEHAWHVTCVIFSIFSLFYLLLYVSLCVYVCKLVSVYRVYEWSVDVTQYVVQFNCQLNADPHK